MSDNILAAVIEANVRRNMQDQRDALAEALVTLCDTLDHIPAYARSVVIENALQRADVAYRSAIEALRGEADR